jgi:peptidoglycan/LPS O-acetylase OafA/YrhL
MADQSDNNKKPSPWTPAWICVTWTVSIVGLGWFISIMSLIITQKEPSDRGAAILGSLAAGLLAFAVMLAKRLMGPHRDD